MSFGDVYAAQVIGSINSRIPMQPVWTLFCTQGQAGASILAREIDETWLSQITPLLSNDLTFEAIKVWNLFNPTDFFTRTNLTNSVGLESEDSYVGFATVSIVYPSTNRNIKFGRKGISGLAESTVTDGQLLGSIRQSWQDFADLTCEPLSDGQPGGTLWQNVIVKRIKYNPSPGRVAYRLPETVAEMGTNYYFPTSAIVHEDLGSQVSRKRF